MLKRLSQIVFVVAVLGMIVYCTTQMRLDSDITHFMPGGNSTPLASLATRLIDSDLSRTMIITATSDGIDASTQAVKKLSEVLQKHPEVSWVKAGLDPDAMQAMYELYHPRRFYFVSDQPEQEIPALLSDSGLHAQADRLKNELLRVSGPLVKRVAPSDPLLIFPGILKRLQASESKMALRGGVFVTEDQRYAVLFLGTRASAFDSARQSILLRDLEQEFSQLQATSPTLAFEISGANRIAVSVEKDIKADIALISAISSLGVMTIFFFFFRSLLTLMVAMIPHFVGALAATTVGLLLFDSLNALAVAFGMSLVGVSIDYSEHLVNHCSLSEEGESPRAVAKQLTPSLVMGALTTIVSFLGMAFTDFPGFHQMGVLASVGIGTSLLVTLFVLPDLVSYALPKSRSRVFVEALERGARFSQRPAQLRGWLLAASLFCVAFAMWGYPRLQWVDDLATLTEPSPKLMQEEKAVRDRVSHFDSVRFVAALAPDEPAALALNDEVFRRLSALQAQGAVNEFRSLHSVIWSTELQEENLRVLTRDPNLYARLASIYGEAGFGDRAFEPFRMALAESPAASPLTLEDLRQSALGDLVRSMVVSLGDDVVVLSYLRGVKDPERIRAALSDLPGALYFDQKEFFDNVYRDYRTRTMGVVLAGSWSVFALLFLRYRKLRPAFAAFFPSILVGFLLVGLAAVFQVKANLMHLVGLTLVMGMGVDYGIFIVDSMQHRKALGATMRSLWMACFTTVFSFGTLGLSSHPVLQALGITTGIGILLAVLLAPLALIFVDLPTEDAGRDAA